jgi:hypothetical protein
VAASRPSDRILIASIAGHESWAATVDRTARTAPGRAALDQSFLDQAGGDPVRAESLRKAHFKRMEALRIQTGSTRCRRRKTPCAA